MAKKPEKPRVLLPESDQLHDLLAYDPETGVLVWKHRDRALFQSDRIFLAWNAKLAGKPAFTMLGVNGYLYGGIWGRRYLAHRIIFKMMMGKDPVQIDHINGARADNRWCNLRETDQAENTRNSARPVTNTSGRIGVYWFKSRNKWIALIKVGGRSIHLGYFDDFEQAVSSRKAAERRLGFHENHGRERSHG